MITEHMITDLWIENFKGIGKRQHIPLEPITLLFGRNSAGKSTILHVLHYLREIITNRNCDAIGPIAGEQTVSLGGFDRFRNRGASQKSEDLTLGIKLQITKAQRKQFDERSKEMYKHILPGDVSHRPGDLDKYVARAPQSVQIELRINRSNSAVSPCVTGFEISANNMPFLNLQLQQSKLARGWVSLISNCWGAPALPLPWPVSPEVSYSFHARSACTSHALLAVLREKFGTERETSSTNGSCNLALNLFEIPNIEPFSFPAMTLLSDAVLWLDQTLEVMPWIEFLQKLNPNDADSEIEMLSEDLNGESAFVILSNPLADWLNGDGEKEKLFQAFERNEMLPPVGLIADSAVPSRILDDLIGVIRHFWTLQVFCCPIQGDEDGTEFQGPWTHPFSVDLDGTALPLADRSFAAKPPDSYVPEMHYVLQYPQTNLKADWPVIVHDTVNQIVTSSMAWLKDALAAVTYIGPKRSAVPRYLSTQTMEEFTEWGCGLGAWRWLLQAEEEAFEKCSAWLNRLGEATADHDEDGYRLMRETQFELSARDLEAIARAGVSPNLSQTPKQTRLFLRDARSGIRLHPQEVGEGITQVVPVIAAMVRASQNIAPLNGHLVAIEQPELHLHPSLAAKLGDLFLATMVGSQGGQCLIETHSEHLILRILRRIRQTTDNELPPDGHIRPVKPDDVCVLWVDHLGDGTTYTRLRISDQGRWLDRWPDGFFRERHEELFE